MSSAKIAETGRNKLAAFLLSSGQSVWLPTIGSSMFPLIASGDLIRIIPLSHAPERGDIAAFWSDGRLVCHRVLDIVYHQSNLYIITSGDSHTYPDPKVPINKVAGIVVEINRRSWSIKRILLLALNFLSSCNS